jgi:hypothetical protein
MIALQYILRSLDGLGLIAIVVYLQKQHHFA